MGLTALGVSSSGTAVENDNTEELEVVEVQRLSGGHERRNIAKIRGSKPIRKLEDKIQSKTGMERARDIAFSVVTDSSELNSGDPVLVIQGYSSNEEDGNDSSGMIISLWQILILIILAIIAGH